MGKDLTTIIKNAETSFECDQVQEIKNIVREWLSTVSLPQQMSEESTRELLVLLVDEPE